MIAPPIITTMKIAAIFISAGLLACTSMVFASAGASTPLTVAWRNKPPLHYKENGVEQGLLLERAKLVFEAAGIPATFVEEPTKRIWANFSSGTPSYCSIGWYHLPERELIAQYSEVFHTDRPHTLLAAPTAASKVKAHRSLASLLTDKELTLGIVDGVSYGPQLDAMIKTTVNRIERKTVEPPLMARIVAANRVSFMFIDRDDWEYLSQRDELVHDAVQIDFPDLPPGLSRYIVCSKDVPAEVMVKINKAIETVRAAKRPSKK
jgi:polar amino acid transport system substrate-binding protein